MWIVALLTSCNFQDEKPAVLEVTVAEIKGSVESKVPGKEKKWAKLEKGATLQKGTMVQTGLKSHALLRFGESTKVLVRSSTFAVINEAYLEKNALRGDVRVDVGSVHVDAERERDPNLEFKVTTPQGTAAVRGTRLGVRTTAEGLEAFSERGITDVNTIFGYEYKLGMHLSQLNSAIGSDLAKMAKGGQLPHLTNDNLKSLDKNQGEQSWTTAAFNPAAETNGTNHGIHYENFCPPHMAPFGIASPGWNIDWHCGMFAKWDCVWDSGSDSWISVQGGSPIATTLWDGGNNRWEFRLHGRVVYFLKNIISGFNWELRSSTDVPLYLWDGTAETMTAQ